jgi:hypothetical protein
MILLQVDSLQQLSSNQGFWENYIWPLAVFITSGLITGTVLIVRQQLKKKRLKAELKIEFVLKIDSDNRVLIEDDKKINSKLGLARQFIRKNELERVIIKIVPNFSLRKLDNYQREELQLRLKNKSEAIRKKLEILLMRSFDLGLEQFNENVRVVFENSINYPAANVTGLIKLDIYRNYDPKIYFPIYVTSDEFKKIAEGQKKSVDKIKDELCIPTLHSLSILDIDMTYRLVIPGLIREIYRIHTGHNFDLATKNWENISGYEIGLG